ncbi:adenylate/guanylate cyclase domain-containing protein [Microvirga pudoricolor]|uniref:adenylate/guanylate cyclase domain-containing protein n=1 Tax=Microvirga pudoricolor TaxID=2778729 RepID=UPI00194F8EAA|nr:adenylate/guanylate cyclase domain-containing protein [Microvirga pudoricolor]MBM6594662.1 adenylate/guanylate cyclase domain-containing protein [Microvirga pudoricolor]
MTGLENWIIGQGLNGTSLAELLTGFAERLVAQGIPVVRAYLAIPTVNPTIRVVNNTWTHRDGIVVERLSHERNETAFEMSPFGLMLREDTRERHWHFTETGQEPFPLFEDIRALGGTDYLAQLVPFENSSSPDLRGVGFAFSSGREGGFLPGEIETIRHALLLLALAAYRMVLVELTISVLDTYVGLSAGRRVLSGEIRRGSGTTLTAALLFADLRGFTALTDLTGASIIGRLDGHLEAMAEPVAEEGGEVLKFMGDGLLAAFPITPERSRKEACAAAVRAAREALARNAAVNRAHPGETPLSLDVALHCGDVFYGNIGSTARLDFTVIGPAVNEVSRMEALCETLGTALVISASVAEASPVPVRSLGHQALRGINTMRELFTLVDL